MIYDVIIFGGLVFWVLFGIATLFMLIFTDSDKELPAISTFLISLLVFFGFSQPPSIDWKFFVGYFVVGAAWWFFVFNVRLLKLKTFLQKNPDYIKEGKIDIPYSSYDNNQSTLNREMITIHENEPSFEKFFSRTFCWPLNMLKFLFSDLAVKVYEIVSRGAILYKNYLLNVR